MSNPLTDYTDLPPFADIRPEHVIPAVEQLLADNRAALESILDPATPRTWASVVQPVEDMDERLDRAWTPVGHLNAVRNNPELREAYNACLPKLSDYYSEVGQNRALFEAWRAVAEGDEELDPAQRRLLQQSLRDFRLAGVDLEEPQRTRFREIQRELSELESKFEDNVLDATQAWALAVEASRLDGLPDHAKEMVAQNAKARGQEGYLLTLDYPVFHAVVTHAADRELRAEMHRAWVTRGTAGDHDNAAVVGGILALRREAAAMLGYGSFAALSLATKMAPDTEAVMAFLDDLVERSRAAGRDEVAMLTEYATSKLGLDGLKPWDVAWVAEKLRVERYAISDEDLRPYFPAPKVIAGMFEVAERLFGVKIREVALHRSAPTGGGSAPTGEGAIPSWHEDTTFYDIVDADGSVRGRFWLDLYARQGKRGGAWMGECRSRRRIGSKVEVPVAWLVCNFPPPTDSRPSLLGHDEVTTLFHEFGHGLHHMLTRVDLPALSGINGVEWDAVELPSQFMENWCWEREALALISGHWETGAPLPDELFERMVAARHYLAAMGMLRQLEFALFDFGLHLDPAPERGDVIMRHLDDVRSRVTVTPVAEYDRYPNSFTHIFGGGYAAGYYSYKWAEVLAADAYEVFLEQGIFDRTTGERFLHAILERGGVRDAMDGFVEFRGRAPSIDALLRQYGMAA